MFFIRRHASSLRDKPFLVAILSAMRYRGPPYAYAGQTTVFVFCLIKKKTMILVCRKSFLKNEFRGDTAFRKHSLGSNLFRPISAKFTIACLTQIWVRVIKESNFGDVRRRLTEKFALSLQKTSLLITKNNCRQHTTRAILIFCVYSVYIARGNYVWSRVRYTK